MKVAVVTPAVVDPEHPFGAERLFFGLVQGLKRNSDADWIQLPISERSWNTLLQAHCDAFDLELDRYDLVISTKSPTYFVQHCNHLCWLVHQVRVFYDRFDDEYGKLPARALAERRSQQQTIQRLDTLAFQRIRKRFSIGKEVSRRLQLYNGFDAQVIYPPVLNTGHYCGSQDYFLLPGRLHRWKRVDLAIRAMKHLPHDVPLLIAGSGEDEEGFRRLAAGDPRIQFLGFVEDSKLLDLYANALAVLFVPKDEDFGFVTIEGMLSHKPVIVCNDSGEPAHIVENGRSGFVVRPDPVEIAGAMAILAGNRELAREMGEYAFQATPPQSWDAVAQQLIQAGAEGLAVSATVPAAVPEEPRIPLLVADNQVLDPPVGGGRIRIYELYRHMARKNFEISYVGAYDWPGPVYRDQMLAPHFRECVTPLTQPHFALNREYERATGGKTTIDVTIPKLLQHSPRFQRMAQQFGNHAEAIIISHPWVYPHVPRRPEQKLIYDSHNCEYAVKQQILGDTPAGRELVEEVRKLEHDLCQAADLIFTCSNEDAEQYVRLYGISRNKIILVPNGVDVEGIQPASRAERDLARAHFGIADQTPALIFIGSGYGPNTEAALFLVKEVAPQLPNCTLIVAGSVKDSYEAAHGHVVPENVKWLGVIETEERLRLYHAADIALNPMFSGSGTNLKMLDYFAAGLPVVSTPAGARGLQLSPDNCVVCPAEQFVTKIGELLGDRERRTSIGANARALAMQEYAWGMIAANAGNAIAALLGSSVEAIHGAAMPSGYDPR